MAASPSPPPMPPGPASSSQAPPPPLGRPASAGAMMLRLPLSSRDVAEAELSAPGTTGPMPPPVELRAPPPPPAMGAPSPREASAGRSGVSSARGPSPDAMPWHEEGSRPSSYDGVAAGNGRMGGSPDMAGSLPGYPPDDLPRRPVAPDGRPVTRRTKESEAHDGVERIRGRRVVYVDHHHVHHHHHFHPSSASGGPGDVPSEGERKGLELRAEEDAERARAGRNKGSGSRSQAADGATARSRGMDASLQKAGFSRGRQSRGREATAGSRSTTSGSWSRGPLKGGDMLRPAVWPPDTEFTAESLVCRDNGWAASTSSTFAGVSFGGSTLGETSVHTTIGTGNPKQLLPLSEYLSLISQLTPETRLKFSPYGVPRSARAISALGSAGVGDG